MASVPPARAPTLSFFAFVLLMVGSCQVYSGVGSTSTRGYLPTPAEQSPEVADSLRNIARIVEDDPQRSALGVATIIAGVLLAFGAIRLMRRRPNGLWWARQGLAANLVVTLGAMIRAAIHLNERSAELIPEVRAVAAATPDGPASAQMMDFLWLQVLVPDGLFVAFVLYLLWRLSRPEMKQLAADTRST